MANNNPTGINQYTKGGNRTSGARTAGTRQIVKGLKDAQSTYSPKSAAHKKLEKRIKSITATIGGKIAYRVPGTGGRPKVTTLRSGSMSPFHKALWKK